MPRRSLACCASASEGGMGRRVGPRGVVVVANSSAWPSLVSVREIAVFSGSAHPQLAAEICKELGEPLLPMRVRRFANDCLEVQLQSNCRERDVFLIQPLSPPVQDNLVELLLMLDAAR